MARGVLREDWITEEKLSQLRGFTAEGYTVKEICEHYIGISRATWYNWTKKSPELAEAVKGGRPYAEATVIDSLMRSAKGFMIPEGKITKERLYNKETGKWELTVTKVEDVYVPPNTSAQIFLAKNYNPEQWNDRRRIDVKGDVNTNTTTKLDNILNELKAKDNE